MSRLTLRKSEDYQRIASLDCQLFPKDYPVVVWDRGAWWLGYIAGVPIAYCGILQLDSEYGYLNRAGVLPEMQGQGIQKKLIARRINYARDMGWSYVVTDTVYDNYASINNLISCGFKVYCPQEPWAREDSIYWIKAI